MDSSKNPGTSNEGVATRLNLLQSRPDRFELRAAWVHAQEQPHFICCTNLSRQRRPLLSTNTEFVILNELCPSNYDGCLNNISRAGYVRLRLFCAGDTVVDCNRHSAKFCTTEEMSASTLTCCRRAACSCTRASSCSRPAALLPC